MNLTNIYKNIYLVFSIKYHHLISILCSINKIVTFETIFFNLERFFILYYTNNLKNISFFLNFLDSLNFFNI